MSFVSEINAKLPEGAPAVRVGDRPEYAIIRLLAHLVVQVDKLTAVATRPVPSSRPEGVPATVADPPAYGRHADRPGMPPGLVWLVVGTVDHDRDGWYRISEDGKRTELVGRLGGA